MFLSLFKRPKSYLNIPNCVGLLYDQHDCRTINDLEYVNISNSHELLDQGEDYNIFQDKEQEDSVIIIIN